MKRLTRTERRILAEARLIKESWLETPTHIVPELRSEALNDLRDRIDDLIENVPVGVVMFEDISSLKTLYEILELLEENLRSGRKRAAKGVRDYLELLETGVREKVPKSVWRYLGYEID